MMMNEKEFEYIHILKSELNKRRKRNPVYSMRAFSKALDISAGVLSMIINEKRIPSLQVSVKLANALDIDPECRLRFIDSVVRRQKQRSLKRIDPSVRDHKFRPFEVDESKHMRLESEYYHTIRDWFHMTIFEMTRLKDFKNSTKWISAQLGISEIEVKMAIDRLLELKLLEKHEDTIRATDEQLRLDDMYNVTSSARRQKQKQIREKSIESIENVPIDFRSMTCMTMCTDISLLPKAKELIRKFNEEMCALLESGENEKVYAVEVSLFPLQK